MLRPDKWGFQFFSLVLTFFSPPMLWGRKSRLSEQENGLVPVARASGCPALDVWLVPRLGSIGGAGFKKKSLLLSSLRPKA